MQQKTTSFWYLGILSAFSLMTFDLYQPALPSITQYFNANQAQGQLTLSLFLFVFGIAQLIWGPLIDHFGRRKTLEMSLILFLCATMVCIFSANMTILIIGRIVQGFAVCCSNVVAFSSTRDYEDSRERARILSHISMIVSISPIFAPLIGSVIFVNFGWHAIFVFMLGLAIFLVFISRYQLEESSALQKSTGRFYIHASLVHYKKILGHAHLWLSFVIISSSFCCIMLVIVNSTYLIIDNLNYSPLSFALLFGCNGFMLILGNYIGIKFRDKKSLTWNIHLGSLLMISGSFVMLLLFFILGLNILSLSPILVIALGFSITNPPAFSLALANYKQQAATATALINTVRITLAALVAGSVGMFIAYDVKLFALSMLFCSMICWFSSLFVSETTNNNAALPCLAD